MLRIIGGGTDIDVIDANTNKRRLGAEAIIFMMLFPDNVKITTKPWKPEYGGKYWYVRFDENNNSIIDTSRWDGHSFDFAEYVIGNCFKTEKEAAEHKDDVVRILHGEPLVKWEG